MTWAGETKYAHFLIHHTSKLKKPWQTKFTPETVSNTQHVYLLHEILYLLRTKIVNKMVRYVIPII